MHGSSTTFVLAIVAVDFDLAYYLHLAAALLHQCLLAEADTSLDHHSGGVSSLLPVLPTFLRSYCAGARSTSDVTLPNYPTPLPPPSPISAYLAHTHLASLTLALSPADLATLYTASLAGATITVVADSASLGSEAALSLSCMRYHQGLAACVSCDLGARGGLKADLSTRAPSSPAGWLRVHVVGGRLPDDSDVVLTLTTNPHRPHTATPAHPLTPGFFTASVSLADPALTPPPLAHTIASQIGSAVRSDLLPDSLAEADLPVDPQALLDAEVPLGSQQLSVTLAKLLVARARQILAKVAELSTIDAASVAAAGLGEGNVVQFLQRVQRANA